MKDDDKAGVRAELDLTAAKWINTGPEEEQAADTAEYAFVTHTDGVTYTLLRLSSDPDTTLVYTPAEWDAFLRGAKDGEFDRFTDAPR